MSKNDFPLLFVEYLAVVGAESSSHNVSEGHSLEN